MNVLNLKVRGEFKALCGSGRYFYLTSVHPENHVMSISRLDADGEKPRLVFALPQDSGAGAVALINDGKHIFAAGTDGYVYRVSEDITDENASLSTRPAIATRRSPSL